MPTAWIFTEIQEKREWDISARERLDFIRQVRRSPLNILTIFCANTLRSTSSSTPSSVSCVRKAPSVRRAFLCSDNRLTGLQTHWGSDTQGVNTTRRFLCEYLSFTYVLR